MIKEISTEGLTEVFKSGLKITISIIFGIKAIVYYKLDPSNVQSFLKADLIAKCI
jgi:hypothetical protein